MSADDDASPDLWEGVDAVMREAREAFDTALRERGMPPGERALAVARFEVALAIWRAERMSRIMHSLDLKFGPTAPGNVQ